MNEIQKATAILHRIKTDGQIALADEEQCRALEMAVAVLTAAQYRRAEIAALFENVRWKEHEMLASVYEDGGAHRHAARMECASAYAELKRRNLFSYYKLYDFAKIVEGDADKILDLAAI